jgi:hypothetical protein
MFLFFVEDIFRQGKLDFDCIKIIPSFVMEVSLETGTKRSRASRRTGPSCSSCLEALVHQVLLNDTGRWFLRN